MKTEKTFTKVPKIIYMVCYESKRRGAPEELSIYTTRSGFERAIKYLKEHGDYNILSATRFLPRDIPDSELP